MRVDSPYPTREGEAWAQSGSLPARSNTRAWITVVFLTLLYTSSYIDRTILGLLVAPIRAALNLSDTGFSLIAGLAFVVVYAVGGVVIGVLVDRWSRRAIIGWGVTIWSVMTSACGFANSFGTLFAARVGVGVGEATLSPASYSLIADSFPKEKLARALSIYTLGVPIGSGLAFMLGGYIVSTAEAIGPVTVASKTFAPWQMVFMMVGLPGLVLAALCPLLIREPAHRKAVMASGASFLDALRQIRSQAGAYGSLFLSVGLMCLFCYGTVAWYPAFLQRVHGLSASEAGRLLGIANLVGGVIGNVGGGILADHLVRKGRRDGHVLVLLVYAAGLLCLATMAPLVGSLSLAAGLILVSSIFNNTFTGVAIAPIQLMTPANMRGKISALYLLIAAFMAFGGGPSSVALVTDLVFQSDAAVGKSIALVGFLTIPLAILVLIAARRAVMAGISENHQ